MDDNLIYHIHHLVWKVIFFDLANHFILGKLHIERVLGYLFLDLSLEMV